MSAYVLHSTVQWLEILSEGVFFLFKHSFLTFSNFLNMKCSKKCMHANKNENASSKNDSTQSCLHAAATFLPGDVTR